MTTTVAAVTRCESLELISHLEGASMSADELATFGRFIDASVSVFSGIVSDQVLCLWGLIPPTLLSDQAYLWLHTTPAAAEHQFVLVRRSQIEMKKMLEEYPKIVGHCEVGAAQSIRWLKWLGAKFGEAADGLVPFVINRQGA